MRNVTRAGIAVGFAMLLAGGHVPAALAQTTGTAAPTVTASTTPPAAAKVVKAAGPRRCTRLGFSVNDYGKDGPTKDALRLLDDYIKRWTTANKIKKYTTGKKTVTCELFLNLIVVDEHTCKAVADVCWNGGPTKEQYVQPLISTRISGPSPMADRRRPTVYCRFEHDGRPAHGRIEGETVRVLTGDPVRGAAGETGATVALAGARLLAPVVPGKIVCVGRNYRSHLGDRAELPVPGLFAKLANAVIGPDAPIPYPADAQELHPEGELVVVIGRAGRAIPESEAMAHVFGLTCGLDMSERVWQKSDLQWLRAKSSDGFGPLGPVLVAELAPDDLLLTTRINGTVMQSERTSLLINPVPRLIAFISRYLRLEAGDVIFTGTPGTTSAVRPGDVVEVEIEGIGRLRNPVVLA